MSVGRVLHCAHAAWAKRGPGRRWLAAEMSEHNPPLSAAMLSPLHQPKKAHKGRGHTHALVLRMCGHHHDPLFPLVHCVDAIEDGGLTAIGCQSARALRPMKIAFFFFLGTRPLLVIATPLSKLQEAQ